LRAGFNDHFVDYYMHIKDAEIARYRVEVTGESDQADVTEWEHCDISMHSDPQGSMPAEKSGTPKQQNYTALNRPDLVAVHESGNGPSRHLP
jgi:hypothetical protein